MEKQKIIEFLKKVWGNQHIEFNNLNSVFSFDEALKKETDIYFLTWVDKEFKGRWWDKEIVTKCMFCIDVDVREQADFPMSNQEITDYAEPLKELLDESELFTERSYIVYTWNWLHVYYVWDPIDINIEQYAAWVHKIYDMYWDLLGRWPELKPDFSCQNIGRILRLPWTKNYKMKTKHNLEPVEATIMFEKESNSRLVRMINQLGKDAIDKKIMDDSKRKSETSSDYFKKKLAVEWVNVYDEICKIPFNDIICEDFGFNQKSDISLFYWPSKKTPQGIVYHEDNNTVYHGGCSEWGDWEVGKTYNPYSYIKEKKRLDDAGTFKRFEDNYAHIAQLKAEAKRNPPKAKAESTLSSEYKIITDKKYDLKSIVPYSRGTRELDRRFGRYDRGVFNVIIGESQSGKTEFTFFQARHNAYQGTKILYISLEMTKEKLLARTARKISGISKEEWSDKSFNEWKERAFEAKYKEFENIENLDIISIENPNINNIEQCIKDYKSKWVELFYIDNMWFVQWEGEEIKYSAEHSRRFKQMTTELGVSINLLHHMNKWSDKDRKWPRGLASIRSSGKIENDADNVIQVWRNLKNLEEQMEEEKAEVKIILQKDREYWEPTTQVVFFSKSDYFDEYVSPYAL